MERRLVRCLPHLDFIEKNPPEFLHSSGRPNRCNPSGVRCLYFSETEATASTEYRRSWQGTAAEDQPRLTFHARVRLRKIIDLGDKRAMKLFGLSVDAFDANWRFATEPTLLQRIGQAIDGQQAITALRFPSAAARQLRSKGWNVAIFPSALAPPDRVEILGNSEIPLEVLP
jgi:RES domain-containing protein